MSDSTATPPESAAERDPVRELCRLLDAAGMTVTLDLLRDPKWQPSREDYAALRDGARAALSASEARREEAERAAKLHAEQLADQIASHGALIEHHAARASALAAELGTTRAKALEESAQVAEDEARQYETSAAECDAGGNATGGTGDTHAALGCKRVAERLGALAASEPTTPEGA